MSSQINKCYAMTKSGTYCSRNAVSGSIYCAQHKKMYENTNLEVKHQSPIRLQSSIKSNNLETNLLQNLYPELSSLTLEYSGVAEAENKQISKILYNQESKILENWFNEIHVQTPFKDVDKKLIPDLWTLYQSRINNTPVNIPQNLEFLFYSQIHQISLSTGLIGKENLQKLIKDRIIYKIVKVQNNFHLKKSSSKKLYMLNNSIDVFLFQSDFNSAEVFTELKRKGLLEKYLNVEETLKSKVLQILKNINFEDNINKNSIKDLEYLARLSFDFSKLHKGDIVKIIDFTPFDLFSVNSSNLQDTDLSMDYYKLYNSFIYNGKNLVYLNEENNSDNDEIIPKLPEFYIDNYPVVDYFQKPINIFEKNEARIVNSLGIQKDKLILQKEFPTSLAVISHYKYDKYDLFLSDFNIEDYEGDDIIDFLGFNNYKNGYDYLHNVFNVKKDTQQILDLQKYIDNIDNPNKLYTYG